MIQEPENTSTEPHDEVNTGITPEPEINPPVDDPDPEITSVFMKVSRAVDGDSHYKNRVNMALEMYGLPQSRTNLVHITKVVAGSILCWVSGKIDTSRVTDEQIITAIETAPDQG